MDYGILACDLIIEDDRAAFVSENRAVQLTHLHHDAPVRLLDISMLTTNMQTFPWLSVNEICTFPTVRFNIFSYPPMKL